MQVRGFEGDITHSHADRTVLATDNSIYQVLPQAAVFPRTETDVVRLAKLSGEPRFSGIVLVPRGGGTGTNGQSLTCGIVVDLSRHMNEILEVNAEEGWARVQAGVVKDQLNDAVRPHGLFFAPELSPSNRATIGGMIATDASGQGSVLYGKTRDHVLDLTAVLLDGTVWHSRPLATPEFEEVKRRHDRVGTIHRLLDRIRIDDAVLIEERFPKLSRCVTGYDLVHLCTASTWHLLPHCTEKTNAPAATAEWVRVARRLGVDLEIVAAGCCGMAGLYGHERANRPTSEAIYELSWSKLLAASRYTGRVVATGYSCRSQAKLTDGTHLLHPLQVLLARVKNAATPVRAPERQPVHNVLSEHHEE